MQKVSNKYLPKKLIKIGKLQSYNPNEEPIDVLTSQAFIHRKCKRFYVKYEQEWYILDDREAGRVIFSI